MTDRLSRTARAVRNNTTGIWPRLSAAVARRRNPYWAFLTPQALAINAARQDHLAQLGVDLSNKRVLEVGAGIGLHTPFFVRRACDVVSTDARAENIKVIASKIPSVRAQVLNLENPPSPERFGHFDFVYCYGALYHLGDPYRALRWLADCADAILLETCVTPGEAEAVNPVSENAQALNQAASGVGCRPTRVWIFRRLQEFWGHAYSTKTQPNHPEFPLDWTTLPAVVNFEHNTRAIFIGSRNQLSSPALLDYLPPRQERSSA